MKFLSKKLITGRSDEELMTDYRRGAVPAFDELYQRYGRKINYYLYKMLNQDKDKADDYTQDVFYRVIKYQNTYSDKIKFSNWIFKIAYNRCIDDYKATSRNEIIDINFEEFSNDSVQFDETIDLTNFSVQLSHELEKLSYDQKTAFLLKYKENYSISDIAAILDCPEGTVKSRLFYTINKLSEKLSIYNPSAKYEKANKK